MTIMIIIISFSIGCLFGMRLRREDKRLLNRSADQLATDERLKTLSR